MTEQKGCSAPYIGFFYRTGTNKVAPCCHYSRHFDPSLYDDPAEACLMFFGALLDVYNANGWVFSLKAGYDDAQNTAYIENTQASDTNWVMDLSVLSGFSWSITGNVNAPSKAFFLLNDIVLNSFLPD